VQTPDPRRTHMTHCAGCATITRPYQPDPGKGETGRVHESIDNHLQDRVYRSNSADRQRNRVKKFQVHASAYLTSTYDDPSLLCRSFVAPPIDWPSLHRVTCRYVWHERCP
jgi:hypothetical protein